MKLKGIAASSGVVSGKVFKLIEQKLEIDTTINLKQDAAKMFLQFEKASQAVSDYLDGLYKEMLSWDSEQAGIFSALSFIAIDPLVKESVKTFIFEKGYTLSNAISSSFDETINTIKAINDPYMLERIPDILDIKKKIIFNIQGIKEIDLTKINEEVIIVAHDLSPSQTVQLDKKFVKGFATEIGGPTSHTAIMARTLNIPSVVGITGLLDKVGHDDTMTLDGIDGEVIINPSKEEIKAYDAKGKKYLEWLETLKKFKGKKSLTKDKHEVELAANIGGVGEVDNVIENDAQAVGLFRSEFLYMDNDHWPTEEEQFNAYKIVLQKMNGKRVIIRTLDIGGDKQLKYYDFPKEDNPFLGYRAIRLCLKETEIFKTQLRALIRASYFGKLGIMIPMITHVKEFLKAKEIFTETYNELKKEKIQIGKLKDIEFGLMIETPAAAILVDKFTKYADFVSIGTNDLIQYSMAADRMNENVSNLYQPLNPSILRFIKHTIDGAHENGKWAGMCGEMAGDKNAVPLLIGLGLDEFSMSASKVLQTRELISRFSFKKLQSVAAKALELDSQEEVKELLKKEGLI
ncbi:Phosphoenolpyruvate-protein phosphotransferase [Mycoplasmopsis californica]|uniref:Phosphoenolpyruvate-protein phosphotransferase n=1 Tax=Mycoplasmopsis equigenitalium TaxID=114883 RepID=A0ABY5J060_9BACT|nr:phosphoenolpyruvate--protein phosphotransferase [Mycoplasmopsis equigenitalium]UUD36659.1 phosphoenolpyruvate--protein phosphotransferase [Mycoplasmopsis equigenitalium]VEU69381.1 Phosphoenolpyruvate-protein phosphotransferase [Mycoplasmopsis californica]